MAPTTALFLLFAVLQGPGGVSLTQLATFNDGAACTKAATAVTTAIRTGTDPAGVFCIRADALESLRPR